MVIGYIRISSQRQQSNTSLENQSQKIITYCDLHDFNLHKIYEEVDSGGNDNRLVLNQLRDLITQAEITTIVIFKLDRLARSMLGGLQFIQYCKDFNVRVISISDNIDTMDPKSDLLLNILLSIATEEKRMIKERCGYGRDMKWKNKELPYGKLSFGYSKSKKGTIRLDHNASIVKYIFRKWNLLSQMKHLTKTKRTQRMLKLLEARGYTYYNNSFRSHHLKQILQNKFYCGFIKWKSEEQKSNYEKLISLRLYNKIQHSFR